MTKVFSFAAIALLALGEGASFAYAVTEETTTSTTANEKVLKTQETDASIEEAAEASSDKVEEVKEEATEETTGSSTESSEEKESKKVKGIKPQADSDPVTIPDSGLYTIIKEYLNIFHGQSITTEPITKGQMEMLKSLKRGSVHSSDVVIANLEGIQYATNLEELNLSGSDTSDTFTSLPTGFSNLKKLKNVNFYNGALNDIDELKNHPALQYFSADQNDLDSLEGLTGCKELLGVSVNGYDNSDYKQNGGIQNFKGLEQSEKLEKLSFEKFIEDRGATRVPAGSPEPSYVGYGLQTLEGLNCATSLKTLSLKGHPGLKTLDGLENYTSLETLKVIGAINYTGRNHDYANPGGLFDFEFDPTVHTPTYRTRGLQGTTALNALKNCTSLTEVNFYGNAIEDISSLAGKSSLTSLTISNNLVNDLTPLSSAVNLERLLALGNLINTLKGLENSDKLTEVDVSGQNGGAKTMGVGTSTYYYLHGLLKDISDLNSTSLVTFNCGDNRLESLSSLKNASNLKYLAAGYNKLSDIKGHLEGCSSLETVYLGNNMFVKLEDMGLEDAKNSLKLLNIQEQGLISSTTSGGNNTDSLLVTIDGLKQYTVLEQLNVNRSKITDDDMDQIPDSIKKLYIEMNELQDKAFSSFDSTKMTQLSEIYANHNHISDITPLEKFTTLSYIYIKEQTITVTKHGGTVVEKTAPVGFEIDVLKSDHGVGLSYTKETGWGTTPVSPTLKPGTAATLLIEDPDYTLDGRTPGSGFSYTSNNALSGLHFQGTIFLPIDYELGTKAELDLIPTDIDGNELKQVEQGETIYWRLNIKGENANFLRYPTLYWDFGFNPSLYTAHGVVDPYDVSTDPQHDQYLGGFRMEIDNQHEPLVDKWWRNDFLHNKINNDKKADIVYVTRVADTAEPGKSAFLQFSLSGDNFTSAFVNAAVPVVPSAGQELKMSVPERLDFGKDNQADKRAKTYGLNAKGYSSAEKTKGLKIRVTDTKKTTSRTDWKVVGQLSDLTNTAAGKLENGSASPKLTIGNIGLLKVTNAGEASESTSPITTNTSGNGNPTWETSIDLTAGGSSTTLAEAPKVDGEGVWDYTIPFDDVKLEVPANVNNQAGRTFNGKITWTLEDVL